MQIQIGWGQVGVISGLILFLFGLGWRIRGLLAEKQDKEKCEELQDNCVKEKTAMKEDLKEGCSQMTSLASNLEQLTRITEKQERAIERNEEATGRAERAIAKLEGMAASPRMHAEMERVRARLEARGPGGE